MNEANIWDGFAKRYDLIVKMFDTSYGAVSSLLVEDIPEGGRVLEVAAGTGQFTLDLAKRTENLIATDVSSEMVARIAVRIEEQGFTNVVCVTMSAYDLKVRDESIDVVFCANALHVMDQPVQALKEFRRVLKTNGRLIAPTFMHGVDPVRRAISRTMSVVSPFVAQTRLDLTQLEQLAVRAGFEIIRSQQLPGIFPIGYVVAIPRTHK